MTQEIWRLEGIPFSFLPGLLDRESEAIPRGVLWQIDADVVFFDGTVFDSSDEPEKWRDLQASLDSKGHCLLGTILSDISQSIS